MIGRGYKPWLIACLVLLGLVVCWQRPPNSRQSPAPGQPVDGSPGAELFASEVIRRIRIEMPREAVGSLRLDPRKDVRATVREGRNIYREVAIHLKGATGSFRPIDDKPGFTLNFTEASPNRFLGLSKIHLNNSVEDPSFMNETLGNGLFMAAGIPAARTAHATVELNGRNLGIYVVKESFTEDFLRFHFGSAQGNFYEPEDGHDIDRRLDRKSGTGPDDQTDLRALAAAAAESDPDRRWDKLGQILDRDRFIDFMAMETMICHRDGYSMARNNFRIYRHPETGRFVFLPHGMDQLFGKTDLTWQPQFNGLVAKTVMETSQGRRLYRERFRVLFTNHFKVASLTDQIHRLTDRLGTAVNRREARELKRQAEEVGRRIVARHQDLQRQLAEPELLPVSFTEGVAQLSGWRAVDEPAGGQMDVAMALDHTRALHIRAGPLTAASWRTKVLLNQGRYRFEGEAMIRKVIPPDFGRNRGAGLRVAGLSADAPHDLTGDSAWKTLAVRFEVKAARQEVELVCELFARSGEAWFGMNSLRLVREP